MPKLLTLILLQVLVKILEVVEIAKHDGSIGRYEAGLSIHLIHILNVDIMRGRVGPLPPDTVHLIPCHSHTSGSLDKDKRVDLVKFGLSF